MRLTALSLQGFRGYARLQLEELSPGVNVFLGANAVGKTNLLEAVSLLSLTKSCRGVDDGDLFRWNEQFYSVKGACLTDDGEACELEVASQLLPRKVRRCSRNGVEQSIGTMVGQVPTVTFLPQDLELFGGSPQGRRAFLDQILCQVSSEYLLQQVHYTKVLKQRNVLLRRIADGKAQAEELALWDGQLAEAAACITLMRQELLGVFQLTFASELSSLGEVWSEPVLRFQRTGTANDASALTEEILGLLRAQWPRDILLQSTGLGPHREDWQVEVAGRGLPQFASRGQQRTAVLALLLLEVSYLSLRRGERPVILLDDVFSELDDLHQRSLLRALQEHQVLITAVQLPSELAGAQVWHVVPGSVERAVEGAVEGEPQGVGRVVR